MLLWCIFQVIYAVFFNQKNGKNEKEKTLHNKGDHTWTNYRPTSATLSFRIACAKLSSKSSHLIGISIS